MKRVAQIEEMKHEAMKLRRDSEGKEDFNQYSFLTGVVLALNWARHNEVDSIKVNEDIFLEVD